MAHESIKKESFFQRKRKASDLDQIDIEDICNGCIQSPENATDVSMYPFKTPKNKSKEQNSIVAIIEANSKFLIIQGPESGLLAHLYDFPNVNQDDGTISDVLQEFFSFDMDSCMISQTELGQVQHLFSHIKRTMIVYHILLKDIPEFKVVKRKFEWISQTEIVQGRKGFPATLKKAFALYSKQYSNPHTT